MAVTGVAGLVLALASLPDVSRLRAGWPDTTSYMRLRVRQARDAGRQLELRYRPVPLERVPERLRRAVLVSEDAAFYGHWGVDLHEVEAALREAWRRGRAPRGASTITQQLARNLYLTPERSLSRKFREAVIALRLEAELSKRRILELYLNVIELGDGVFGVQAGSTRYFGRPVGRLTRRQAAELAATIPAPRTHNPATRTAEFAWRADLIYRRAFGGTEPASDGGRPGDAGAGSGAGAIEGAPGLPAGDTVRVGSPVRLPPPR